MSISTLDLAIIGAGAAGLYCAHFASGRTSAYEVFDEHDRVGDSWRERYRSLRLFTPRRWTSLPGLRIEIGRFAYPTATQLADYLERYAAAFAMPVRTGTRVERLSREPDGRFRLDLSTGDETFAERVVVTAGAHRRPVTPEMAGRLDPRIRQLHSLDYRGPEDLAPGPVLVVGAANSGTDVALEAAASGHDTVLAGRHPGQVPAHIDNPIGNLMSEIFIRRLRNTTIDTERGRRWLEEHRGHGVNLVRNHVADLARAGVRQVGRVVGERGGKPVLDDGEALDAATVVWCTGSVPDHAWIDIPAAFAPDGVVQHRRGLVDAVPGLAFVGLPFLYSVASPTLMGMGRDAEYVVTQLLAQRPALTAV